MLTMNSPVAFQQGHPPRRRRPHGCRAASHGGLRADVIPITSGAATSYHRFVCHLIPALASDSRQPAPQHAEGRRHEAGRAAEEAGTDWKNV